MWKAVKNKASVITFRDEHCCSRFDELGEGVDKMSKVSNRNVQSEEMLPTDNQTKYHNLFMLACPHASDPQYVPNFFHWDRLT